MSTAAPNYHFVSKTASTYNILVVSHLAIAVFSSIFDVDVSSAVAVMGIISVINASVPLVFLYLLFAPATILVDIIRLAILSRPTGFGFLVFLKVMEMLVKGGAVFFGYQVYSSSSSGDGAGGYEQINHGPPPQPPQSFPQVPDPFNPSAYTAPAPATGAGADKPPQVA